MNKNQVFALGAAGAVLHNSRASTDDSRIEAVAIQADDSSSSKDRDDHMELIRESATCRSMEARQRSRKMHKRGSAI